MSKIQFLQKQISLGGWTERDQATRRQQSTDGVAQTWSQSYDEFSTLLRNVSLPFTNQNAFGSEGLLPILGTLSQSSKGNQDQASLVHTETQAIEGLVVVKIGTCKGD